MSFRVGFGYDVHRLQQGENLILGGISIPSHVSAIGHSDADALIHSLCDAMLGAAGLRDIGYHFPDTDHKYKNIDSKILLKHVMDLIRKNGFELGNADCTICLEKPKINPHVNSMIQTLAVVMNVSETCLSIKATTNEKIGFVGREEGIAVYCVVLLMHK